MYFLSMSIAVIAIAVMAMVHVRAKDRVAALEKDATVHYSWTRKAVETISERDAQIRAHEDCIKQMEQFAIRDFKDRDELGKFAIPFNNPHTGARILKKWTAIEDEDGRVLYGPKYEHKFKAQCQTEKEP
jgi:hypothetical protein